MTPFCLVIGDCYFLDGDDGSTAQQTEGVPVGSFMQRAGTLAVCMNIDEFMLETTTPLCCIKFCGVLSLQTNNSLQIITFEALTLLTAF